MENNRMYKDKDKKEHVNQERVEEGIEQLEKERDTKKNLPKKEQDKINQKVFENLLIANAIMAFLYFIGLGSLNIETSIFLVDLKVFSMGFIIFTIILFEISYQKENGHLCIHGIEGLVLSIFILFSNYLYAIDIKNFQAYVSIFAYAFAIYYIARCIILSIKMKEQYIASLSDIEEIIKK